MTPPDSSLLERLPLDPVHRRQIIALLEWASATGRRRFDQIDAALIEMRDADTAGSQEAITLGLDAQQRIGHTLSLAVVLDQGADSQMTYATFIQAIISAVKDAVAAEPAMTILNVSEAIEKDQARWDAQKADMRDKALARVIALEKGRPHLVFAGSGTTFDAAPCLRRLIAAHSGAGKAHENSNEAYLTYGKIMSGEIGKSLHAHYGLPGMIAVHQALADYLPDAVDDVGQAWDGIGDWIY